MNNSQSAAIALVVSQALLRGVWEKMDMSCRIRKVLITKPPLPELTPFLDRVLATHPVNCPRPLLQHLQSTVLGSLQLLLPPRQKRGHSLFLSDGQALQFQLRTEKLPCDVMVPVAGLTQAWPVHSLTTIGQLGDWLGLNPNELEWFALKRRQTSSAEEEPLRHYRYRWLPKPSSGSRLLEIPKSRLKLFQRQILENILDAIPPHVAAHAYRRGYSLASYLAPHVRQKVVVRFDVRDFFSSVRGSLVHATFRSAGYPEPVADMLTNLCTHTTPKNVLENWKNSEGRVTNPSTAWRLRQPHLPQGAPTSPALANLCAYRLDCRLSGLAGKSGAVYTRYADDMVFSGGHAFRRSLPRFRLLVKQILLTEGFEIRGRKTQVMLAQESQSVSGVILNDRLNLPRSDYDKLKAILHQCLVHGPLLQNRENHPHFREHLQGKICYWKSINPVRGEKLRRLFDQISWGS